MRLRFVKRFLLGLCVILRLWLLFSGTIACHMSSIHTIEASPFFFEAALVHLSVGVVDSCELWWINVHGYWFIIGVSSVPIVLRVFYPFIFLCLQIYESLPIYVLLSFLLGGINPLFKSGWQSLTIQNGCL